MLIDGEGIDLTTHFGMDEIGVYMGSGIRIAKIFGFLLPTKVRLDYEGGQNLYKLTQLGTVHIPNVFPVQVKEEPIEIISDDDAEVEQVNEVDEEDVGEAIEVDAVVVDNVEATGGVDYHHFEKNVTEALASVEKPQVLVCERLFFIIKFHLILSKIIYIC